MSDMEWIHQPRLRDPIAVMAFEGWNDAADAATGVVEYLITQHAEGPFAQLDLENHMNYQMSRPLVSFDDGRREVHWPATGLFEIKLDDHDHDLVAVLSEEPHLRWPTYCRRLIAALTDIGVQRAITIGAFIGQVPHTIPTAIFGSSTDPEFVDRLAIEPTSYEGPTGITGVMHAALANEGFEAATIWAAVPHYLSANPSPKATRALLGKLEEAIGFTFETAPLDLEVADYDTRVDEAIRESSDFLEYVRELEQQRPDTISITPADSEQLVEEIERFLRDPNTPG